MKSNDVRVHLPPVAVKEASNLQNFFPLPRLEEEEEALALAEGAEDAPQPDDFPEDWGCQKDCENDNRLEVNFASFIQRQFS